MSLQRSCRPARAAAESLDPRVAAFWHLGGEALAWLDFTGPPAPTPGVSYSLTVLVSPDNAFLNSIMSLGLFRNVVRGQIQEVVDDIAGATAQLATGGMDSARRKGTWMPEEEEQLRRFLSLP